MCAGVVLVFLLSLTGRAQAPARQLDAPSCSIRELFNREGWDIAGLSKTKTTQKIARWTTGGLEGVFVETLKSDHSLRK